jgi:hypothetical protein
MSDYASRRPRPPALTFYTSCGVFGRPGPICGGTAPGRPLALGEPEAKNKQIKMPASAKRNSPIFQHSAPDRGGWAGDYTAAGEAPPRI